jgi:hypothetical protein
MAEAAKQLYFWPKMNEHIKDMIDACERCQFYKSLKQKQEQIQQTPFKDLYPMAEVGSNLFGAGKHHFLIVVDRYSEFPLVARLNSMAAESIIGHMEKMFFLLGRPGEIKCDKGAMLQDRIQELGKGERHHSQQLRPKQAHEQQTGRTRRRHRQAHAAETSSELRGIRARLNGI